MRQKENTYPQWNPSSSCLAGYKHMACGLFMASTFPTICPTQALFKQEFCYQTNSSKWTILCNKVKPVILQTGEY